MSFAASTTSALQPLLVTGTDVCFWLTVLAVAVGFGGRMASGQLALVIGASATALCWMLYQCTTSEPRYVWTGSEFVWCAGILVSLSQIIHLPINLLLMLSPKIKADLPLWFDKEFADLFPAKWDQLSLAPWETASGMATFTSYGMLFLVAAQRTRTVKDVERTLCLASLASIAMMLFAQLQFWTSNGKFFWSYEHPYMNTDTYPLGCFTNRNHLAQFLVLGTAPTIWWLLRRLQQQEQDATKGKSIPAAMHVTGVSLLLVALGALTLTVLMTLSRGGLLALTLTSAISIGLMCRIGLASMRFGVALMLVGMITAGVFSFSKYESILANRLEQNSGRSEIWLANIKVAADFPILGTGIGTHGDAYQLHIEQLEDDGLEYSHAESGYLQVASESGIVGLTVAAMMIITSIWWCVGALWNKETNVTSAAAAILASLIANILHAIGDFFWYTPVCMLILGVQLACAMRLYRLTRQDAGRFVFSFRLPRLITAGAICGLVPVFLWMLDLKVPAAMAEPHRIQSLLLSKNDERDVTDEERAATNERRLKEAIMAARLDPRDAKLQESAGAAYLQLFDLKQTQSDNSMSSSMLRDAVKGSHFESLAQSNAWLDQAIGANMKLLRTGGRAIRRSLANCPLRAKAYVLLTEISFLDHIDNPDYQQCCLDQALTLRPTDCETQYLVGKSGLQEGNLEKALVAWRPAFTRSSRMQERISRVLSEQMTPEFFEEEFHPDWKALNIVGNAFVAAGREAEAIQVKRKYVEQGMEAAQKMDAGQDLETALISLRNTCRELNDIPAAATVLTYGAKRIPHSYSIRYMLALDLLATERTAEAAEHLKWCSTRRPDDQNLRKVTTLAVAERMKQTSSVRKKEIASEPKTLRR